MSYIIIICNLSVCLFAGKMELFCTSKVVINLGLNNLSIQYDEFSDVKKPIYDKKSFWSKEINREQGQYS
jgi:hypothetical protein